VDKKGKTQYADDLLGSMRLFDCDFSVRERSPYKETLPTNTLTSRDKMLEMCTQWGRVLATEHERAHYNHTKKPKLYPLAEQVSKLTKGKKKEFVKQVSKLAQSYARQVEEDWRHFRANLAPKDCQPSK